MHTLFQPILADLLAKIMLSTAIRPRNDEIDIWQDRCNPAIGIGQNVETLLVMQARQKQHKAPVRQFCQCCTVVSASVTFDFIEENAIWNDQAWRLQPQ